MKRRCMAVAGTTVCLAMVSSVQVENIQATSSIYGMIWREDLRITGAQLLGSCYEGYALFDCRNQNWTSDRAGVSNQFLPGVSYCLNCCGNPTATGTDETWNLICPMTPLQRSTLINDIRKKFVFARRATMTDETVVSCAWPSRNSSLFLAGYELKLHVTMYSIDDGWHFWIGVDSCAVKAIETNTTPTTFNERIRLISVRPPYEASSNWYILLAAVLITSAFAAWVLYRGYYKDEHCVNCASKLVVINQLCVFCIVCGCRIHAPPPRVFCAPNDDNIIETTTTLTT
ncbi:hypothetical protein Ae201684P_000753 [Aphanomyces euteiches]|nr:hypothetical protein Ae201684P_000753 [Aphanomyces euteiches]